MQTAPLESRDALPAGAGVLRLPRGTDSGDLIAAEDTRLIYLHPHLVGRLHDRLRANTIDCVMQTFGISFNTWTKIRKGQAIRKSVAERLIRRLHTD